MKHLKKILIVVFVAFVGIQFVPTKRNQSDEILATDISKTFDVPQNIKSILENSCYDCHSNNTEYPWYNKIQPVGFFLEHHVEEGKEELNFSEFGAYSKRKTKSKLKSIISQIKEGEMPLFSYIIIHRNSKLSHSDREALEAFFGKIKDSL